MTKNISLSEKIYATLLGLYPAEYKVEFGGQMLQLFQDMYEDAKRSDDFGVINLWIRIIPDYFASVTKEYLSSMKGGDYYMRKNFDTAGLAFWVIAGAAVFPITFFLSMYIIKILGLGDFEDQVVGFIFIPFLVLSLVGSQWLILKKYTDRARDWLINTITAWIAIIGLTFAVVGILFKDVPLAEPSQLMLVQFFQATAYGAVLGYFQKRALTGYKNTWLLAPANILAILMIWASIGESISGTVDMMLVGTYPALFTGVALLFILGKKTVGKGSRQKAIA